jgi:ectoine hydroxylase-related dioxygenase (phytanoyl-CoA dioxygenase family)
MTAIAAEYTTADALREYGVDESTLSADEKGAYDAEGYCVFDRLIDGEWLKALSDRFNQLIKKEGASAGSEFSQEKGAPRLSDLVNKGAVFDRLWTHPKLLASAAWLFRRDFKLLSINGRDASPGEGGQALHADWGRRTEPVCCVCNAIVLLDDYAVDNGATRVVPGTHKLTGVPVDYVKDPRAPHPQELVLTAPAGSVVMMDSHLWHGGTVNRLGRPRRVYHVAYVGREQKQYQINQREYLRKATFDRLPQAARYILDVDLL